MALKTESWVSVNLMIQIFALSGIINVTTPFYYRSMLLIDEINNFYDGKEEERY